MSCNPIKPLVECIQRTIEISAHGSHPVHHGSVYILLKMSAKLSDTIVKLPLKALLHGLKGVVHLLPKSFKVGCVTKLHLLKLRSHGLLQ